MKVTIQLSSVKKEENRDAPGGSEDPEVVKLDRRLQRLQRLKDDPSESQQSSSHGIGRRRRAFEPEVIEEEPERDVEPAEDVEGRHASIRERLIKQEEEQDERQAESAQKSSGRHVESSEEESDEDEESDEESEEDSEDEFFNSAPKLKPIFVRKQDRTSIINQKKEAEEKAKQEEAKNRKAAEDRRKAALKMIETTVQREKIEADQSDANFESINSVKTDDESDEVAYLNWKLRELKRNKRDKEEREAMVREKEEVERLRNMTEEERLEELRKNPKVVANQQEKGKYKFMQKYYHRGAYFLDDEQEILKRDVAKPTLEDHFDKTVLPKVMQVKNFGRSGQTKYTHLVDQDTTDQQSPWYTKDNQSAKAFHEKHGAGMKQVFERPSKKRRNW